MAGRNWDEGARYRALKTAAGLVPFGGPAGTSGGLAGTMKQVGALMKARAQKAFVDQRRGAAEWPARGVPNVMGIIADLHAGRVPPARRFEARPAGVDTGQLRASIAFRQVARDAIEVGSVLPYAGIVNWGGTSKSPVIDDTILSGLYRFLYGSKSKGIRRGAKGAGLDVSRKSAKKALGWLFGQKGKSIEVEVPPRPFVTLEPQDVRDIVQLVGVSVAREAR